MWRQGLDAQAEVMVSRALGIQRGTLNAEDSDILLSMSLLGSILDDSGKHSAAKTIERQTIARYEKVLGAEHPHAPTSVYCLAYLLANQRL